MKTIRIIILLTFLCFLVKNLPNQAPYIHQEGRPLNIAHRGLCSILPQNTMEAFQAALYQGADFIELDILYTKDHQLIVMHDAFLSRITNIKNLTQYQHLKQTRTFEGESREDWWIDQFTTQELKSLFRVKQDQAPGRIGVFDFKFTLPTLDQVVQMVLNFNQKHKGQRNSDKRIAGILIQAKNPEMFRELYGLNMAQDTLNLLQKYGLNSIKNATEFCPIYLHSFDYETVKYWGIHTKLPNNYLIQGKTPFDLQEVALYATGMGLEDSILWNYQKGEPNFQLLNEMRRLQMIIHIWTFKDDMLLFNSTCNIQMYKKAHNSLKLDGVITESADVYAPIAKVLSRQALQQKPVTIL